MKETGERILQAATAIFARHGVSGATTREIAHRAKVNEVTLFRYFKNKHELLRQVVLQHSRKYADVFAEVPCATIDDVNRTVENFASVYLLKLSENEEFFRTFVGELTRHPKLCRRLFVESTKPVRQRFIDYLSLAQKRKLIRPDLDPATTADALSGMLMSGVLRRPLTDPEYPSARFSRTCVDLFLKGIKA